MTKVIKDSNGQKLYPVCGFQRSQHKLYYWENKAYLKAHADEATDSDWAEWAFWQEVCEYASCVHDGLIYMPYKFYGKVKDAIALYDMRH